MACVVGIPVGCNAVKTEVLERYAGMFTRLHTDREAGRPRPHKATMLLSVMTLVEAGRLPDNRIVFDPVLLQVFADLFAIVRKGSDTCTPYNPFFYLKSSGFWHLHAQPGQEAALAAVKAIRGSGQLRELVSYASLDDQLLALLGDRTAREVLRLALIDAFFPDRKADVLEILSREVTLAMVEGQMEAGKQEKPPGADRVIRDIAFARVVKRAYDFQCAACGLRVLLDDLTTMVDAAHLIPHSETGDDDPRNGMALCKNHHWAMDQYLICPGTDYVWRVSPRLDGRRDGENALMALHSRRILLPRERQFYPKTESLEWRMAEFSKSA